jgi:hypothetical protein
VSYKQSDIPKIRDYTVCSNIYIMIKSNSSEDRPCEFQIQAAPSTSCDTLQKLFKLGLTFPTYLPHIQHIGHFFVYTKCSINSGTINLSPQTRLFESERRSYSSESPRQQTKLKLKFIKLSL